MRCGCWWIWRSIPTTAISPLKDIARRQEISEKYLESIVRTLVQAQILEGLRGKGGGYRLKKPPEQYTAAEILRVTEGPLAPVACLDRNKSGCPRAGKCQTLPMWEKLDSLINGYLDSVSLVDLIHPDAENANEF